MTTVRDDSPVIARPDDTAGRIREYIRTHPDIRKQEYATADDALQGSCYVAAEAYFHARGGVGSGLDIYCLSWGDVDATYSGTHWFLGMGDTVIDLSLPTAADGQHIPWATAHRRAFITGYEPSRRAETLLGAVTD
ncbi:hypothetical protein ACFPYI_01960 [Halomarina salina]|uniref:Uncharacterized protein n=1 Tax=Halomarina salina TaxID=1872699 RepID=A0ABD5RHZ6_9EURY|nr:hypothetical protein [Halomarina salina]